MFQGVIEVHDLHRFLETLRAHGFEPRRSVDEEHDLVGVPHPPPQGLASEAGPELVDGLKAGDVGRRVPVPG